MTQTKRMLPYTRQLVMMALYDVLEQEHSDYKKDGESSDIVTVIKVYDNESEFAVSVKEESPATEMTVTVTKPHEGLSEQGRRRAADYIADRVAQLLENELKINSLMKEHKCCW